MRLFLNFIFISSSTREEKIYFVFDRGSTQTNYDLRFFLAVSFGKFFLSKLSFCVWKIEENAQMNALFVDVSSETHNHKRKFLIMLENGRNIFWGFFSWDFLSFGRSSFSRKLKADRKVELSLRKTRKTIFMMNFIVGLVLSISTYFELCRHGINIWQLVGKCKLEREI